MPQPQQLRTQTWSAIYTTAHCDARSLTHWVKPGMELTSSWILVRFVTCWAPVGAHHWCFVLFCFFFWVCFLSTYFSAKLFQWEKRTNWSEFLHILTNKSINLPGSLSRFSTFLLQEKNCLWTYYLILASLNYSRKSIQQLSLFYPVSVLASATLFPTMEKRNDPFIPHFSSASAPFLLSFFF